MHRSEDVDKTNKRDILMSRSSLQLSPLPEHGAAMLDFQVALGEVFSTIRVGKPTSGGVPVTTSSHLLTN